MMKAAGRRRGGEDSSQSRERHRKRKREIELPGKDKKDRKEKKEKKSGTVDRRDRDQRSDRGKDHEEREPLRHEKDRGDGRDRDSRREAGGTRHRDGGRDEKDRDRGHGGRSRRVPEAEPPMPPEGDGKATSNSAASAKPKPQNWRDEAAQVGGDDERDLSTDEEEADRKLAEARKRREELKAKVQAKQVEARLEQPESADTLMEGDTPGQGLKAPANENGGGAPAGEAGKTQEESFKDFITDNINGAGEQEDEDMGDMFDDRDEAAEDLKKANKQLAVGIGYTGASGEDWDDKDGYYIAKVGEVMDDRYLVVEQCAGKGVFSNVVKAKDQHDPEQPIVAIKLMRANDMITKAAEKEIEILQKLNEADKGNKRHIIRLIETFVYRKHLCLVFEAMWDDLRQALKKFTKNKGMSMEALRVFTKQLLIGLRHMNKCQIIHADIKPDNILISKGHNSVKYCDLGTALDAKDANQNISPYFISRFYRPPEIVLGCECTVAADTWALGCTLYELFTGKVLVPSRNNTDHLKRIMELKGKIPSKVIKKGMLWKNHFTEDLDFKYEDEDKATGEKVTRTLTNLAAKKTVKDLVFEKVTPEVRTSTVKQDQDYVKRVQQLGDLLEQMFTLDPEKRITAEAALSHPFLQEPGARREMDAAGRAGRPAAGGRPR